MATSCWPIAIRSGSGIPTAGTSAVVTSRRASCLFREERDQPTAGDERVQ